MALTLAFLAAAAAVAGGWELLAAVERTRPAALLAAVMRAGRDGASPSAADRRRFALLAAAVLAAAGWLIGGVVVGLLAGVTGPAVAAAVVRSRRRRYRSALAAAAPVVARALAGALSSGHSVRGALPAIAAGLPGAAGAELRAAARALALGTRTETVLETLRRRARSPAWDAMVAGILLQRDAGGDLPALLRAHAASLEAAARQNRDALVATAQARFTARIVFVLPLGAALLAELAQPGLLTSLFANPVSAWLTCLALLLQLVAFVAVHRLTRSVMP